MPVKIAAEYAANEEVTIDRYDPGDHLVESFKGVTKATGEFEIILDSWPSNTPGKWTYKLKGKTGGKELALYIWLDLPVTKPTVFVTPTSGTKDQVFYYMGVGFKPGETVYFSLKCPCGNGKVFTQGGNTYPRTGSGGGIIYGFPIPRNYPFTGVWTFAYTTWDTTGGARSAAVDFTITE